jgi:hypothetical protein
VPYSGQTIIQALALAVGIGVYSIRWTRNGTKLSKLSNMEENNGILAS